MSLRQMLESCEDGPTHSMHPGPPSKSPYAQYGRDFTVAKKKQVIGALYGRYKYLRKSPCIMARVTVWGSQI